MLSTAIPTKEKKAPASSFEPQTWALLVSPRPSLSCGQAPAPPSSGKIILALTPT